MGLRCEICGKSVSFGRIVSHSNKRSPRKIKPNIRKVRAVIDGKVRRVKICTSCLKLGRIQKAI